MSEAERRQAARSVGIWILIGADALFWASLLFIYAMSRAGGAAWPDIIPGSVAGPGLPLLFAGGLVVAALVGRRPALAFFALLASLSVLGYFWFRAAEQGLTPRAGRYGLVVYLTTMLLGIHALGGMVAAGIRLGGEQPSRYLRRFLAALAVIAVVTVVAVFVL